VIAEWMLYTSLVGGCAATAAFAAEPMLASRGLARRWAWVAALIASVLVPLLVAIRPASIGRLDLSPSMVGIASRTTAGVAAAGGALDWDRWLLLGWGLASIALLVVFATGAVGLWRARWHAPRVELEGERVILTRDTGPGALWFGVPRIVMPESLLALDPARRSLLVRHEREHVRAGDPHLLLAALAAVAVMPWNVALWLVARRLRVALELDCDARVLSGGADVRTYGELLLTVAASRRPSRLVPYLAFAATPTPLEQRIRTMTSKRRPLRPLAQLALGFVALTALVAACEARRPDPVAPVTSYTVADGQVTASQTPSGAEADSAKARLGVELRERVPGPTLDGNAADPLLMVYEADGNVVMSGRIGRNAIDSLPFPPERIATVNVIKSGAMLPPEAKGGLIKVVLKPDGGLLKRRATESVAESAGSPNLRARSAEPTDVTLVISDSEGRELYRQSTSTSGSTVDATLARLKVDKESIATVDVRKTPEDRAQGRAEIHVTLKAGRGIGEAR